MAIWRRYLLFGLVASAICVTLPQGFPRDIIYFLIGFSSVTAILVGIRRNRPTHAAAWYLFAAASATWTVADGLYGWYEHVTLVAPFPSIADHASPLGVGWPLTYVLWGAAALHPSMRALSSPPPRSTLRLSAPRMLGLGLAVAIGPAVLAAELLDGDPQDVVPILIVTGVSLALAIVQAGRIMRLQESQTKRLAQLADTDYVTDLPICQRFSERLSEFLGDTHGQVAAFLLVNVSSGSPRSTTPSGTRRVTRSWTRPSAHP